MNEPHERLLASIRQAWSPATTDDWHPEDPGLHQCGVTALVVQDHFGGTIVRNKIGGLTCYFNRLPDGSEIFWDERYAHQPRAYPHDQEQSREQVMRHTDMPRRYAALTERLRAIWRPHGGQE